MKRAVWVIAAAHAAVLLVLATRHGFHRDELYFLEAGQHLALGYVDQPPLVPLLARLQTEVFGTSVAALRIVPALVSGGSVVLAGMLAAELGGGRRAQALAAGAMAGAGFVLATGHLLSTATLDLAFWMALLLVTTRMVRTGDPRWWLAHGGLAGLAMWNKYLAVLLTVAVLVGLVAERRWDLLRPRWLLAGGLLAVGVAAPTLVWQVANDLPQLEMAQALSDRIGAENRATLVPLQLVLLGPPLVPLGWVGARHLWVDGPRGLGRVLVWAWGAALLLTLVTGGRPYYPLPLTATVVIAGAVALEHRWGRLLPGLVAASAAGGVLLALPVLPVRTVSHPALAVNDTLAEQVGWPQLAAQVADVVDALPGDTPVVIVTGTYGEAGALDRYGPELGLPTVYSGHNSYWHWRRPTDDDATVIAIRMREDLLREHFATCTSAGTVDNGLGVDNEVQGSRIEVCRGLRTSWEDAWPAFRRYS